jgi:hypothetical protein
MTIAQCLNSKEYSSNDESSHHYRTEIPNIIFEMGLDPFELSLYCYLKKTAGDNGACWKSIQTLCEETKFGRTKLMKVKSSLESKGLIKISKRNNPKGGKSSDLITIVDLWPINIKRMAEKFPDKHISINQTRVVRHANGGGPPNGHKEEPNKEEPNKQQQAAAVSFENKKIESIYQDQESKISFMQKQHNVYYPPSNQYFKENIPLKDPSKQKIFKKQSIYECLEKIDIPFYDKLELTRKYSFEIVKNAIEWSSTQIIKTTLVQVIKYGALRSLSKPIEKVEPKIIKEYEIRSFNIHLWKPISDQIFKMKLHGKIRTSNDYIEIESDKIYFKDCSFLEQIENLFRKLDILNENILKYIQFCREDFKKIVTA